MGPNGIDEAGKGDDISLPCSEENLKSSPYLRFFNAILSREEFKAAEDLAKAKRARMDLRTLAIAMESYYTDHSEYPPTLLDLTTPIPYLSSLLYDPFTEPGNARPYRYYQDEVSGDRIIYSIGINRKDESGHGDDIARIVKYKGSVPFSVKKMNENEEGKS